MTPETKEILLGQDEEHRAILEPLLDGVQEIMAFVETEMTKLNKELEEKTQPLKEVVAGLSPEEKQKIAEAFVARVQESSLFPPQTMEDQKAITLAQQILRFFQPPMSSCGGGCGGGGPCGGHGEGPCGGGCGGCGGCEHEPH